jgi:hypothetical protein
MAITPNSAEEESGPNFIDVDREARRPLVVERHHHRIEELEAGVTDDFISGKSDILGMLAMLKYLNDEFGRNRMDLTMRALVDDPHYREMTLRSALVEQICLLCEQSDGESSTMTSHIVGVYRQIRDKIAKCQGEAPMLGDLRALPMTVLARLFHSIPLEFGSPTLADSLVYTPSFADRSMRTITRIRHAVGADTQWLDATDRPLRRELEEPLANLPEGVRRAARQLVVAHRVRSRFYRDVFLDYLTPGKFDAQKEYYATILHWLEDIEGTAHLFPFMQGQASGQKAWRLAQLTQKIVQLHEMYARLAMASQHSAYSAQFAGRAIRERLALLSRDHYPPLALTKELTLAALLCPFKTFAAWVQGKIKDKEFVLPPDPMR